jgi:subtilisin family serine protease
MRNKIILLTIIFLCSISSYSQPDTISYEKGKIWIGLKEPLQTNNLLALKKALKISEKEMEINSVKSIKNIFNSKDEKLSRAYELSFEGNKDLVKYLKKFESDFEYVEYVPKVYVSTPYTPNDFVDDPDTLWHIDHLGLREAWNLMTGISRKTKVAIIDNGYDGDHEDLIGNITHIEPIANNNEHHGTAVAGIAGMTTNNGIGYCSVAGLYSDLYLYLFNDVPTKIVDATNANAKVINMSFIHCTISQTYIDAINYAYSNGVLLVAAAGNCQCSGSCTIYHYPASYDHVLSVASLDKNDIRNAYPYCATTYNDKVDISAPGWQITSTDSSNTYYHTGQCTSAASPMVAGTAALLLAINPYLTPDQLECILKTTAFNIYQIPGNTPYIGMLGAGRLDALAAVTFTKNASVQNLTGSLGGTYTKFIVNVSNATVTNNVAIHAKEVTINGPFSISSGKTFTVDNSGTFSITCN